MGNDGLSLLLLDGEAVTADLEEKEKLDIKRLVNDEEVTDHTALLPTKNKAEVDFEKLNISDDAKKVLQLVYQNLEEATSMPYKYEKTRVTLSYGDEMFTAVGVRNLELGWKKNRPYETTEHVLPEFNVGDKVVIEKVFIKEYQTEPPQRFTDGELLKAMEVAGKESADPNSTYLGIGTAATRAEIIESLVSKGYVERVGEENGQPQSFVPTGLACSLYSVLPDSLKSAELTAEWEKKLSEVEKGTLEPQAFMEQINSFIRTILDVR